jgi:hypothetical protein
LENQHGARISRRRSQRAAASRSRRCRSDQHRARATGSATLLQWSAKPWCVPRSGVLPLQQFGDAHQGGVRQGIRRLGQPATDLLPQVIARSVFGARYAGFMSWLSDERGDLSPRLDRALQAMTEAFQAGPGTGRR